MLALNEARRSVLTDAYGGSAGIPNLLADAEKLPEDADGNAEPYFSLWLALCHQGDVYCASYAALPHLLRIVEENPGNFRWTLLLLAHAIELARSEGRGPPMPNELMTAYQDALASIPATASGLLGGELSEVEVRVILAACASAKGFPLVGEAITELTPEVTTRFLEDGRTQ
jgi:hypothetical protein